MNLINSTQYVVKLLVSIYLQYTLKGQKYFLTLNFHYIFIEFPSGESGNQGQAIQSHVSRNETIATGFSTLRLCRTIL